MSAPPLANCPLRTSAGDPTIPMYQPILLAPVWETLPKETLDARPDSSMNVLIVGGTQVQQGAIRAQNTRSWTLEYDVTPSIEEFSEHLRRLDEFDHVVWILPNRRDYRSRLTSDDIVLAQQDGIVASFRFAKALIQLEYGRRRLVWTVITRQAHAVDKLDPIDPTHAGVHGFFGSLSKEQPRWSIRLVDLPIGEDAPFEEVFRLPADGNTYVFRRGLWLCCKLIICHEQTYAPPTGPYRRGGVYVIAGGAGGIGDLFSAFLAEKYEAHLIWLGRRPLNDTIQRKLHRISTVGPTPMYVCVDATDRNALSQAYLEIKKRHSEVHGFVHSALVLLDSLVENMTEDHLKESLAAKITLTVRLAQTFCKEPLDFALFFSSFLTFTKPPGQSNYVAGCAFKDAYASALSQLWMCPVKVMNWGYWGSVGVVSTDRYRARMRSSGLGSIEPTTAMAALESLLLSPFNQLALLQPSNSKLFECISSTETFSQASSSASQADLKRALASVRDAAKLFVSVDEGSAVTALPQELLLALLISQLRKIGLNMNDAYKPNPIHIHQWKISAQVPALYSRWLDHTLQVLVQGGNTTASITPSMLASKSAKHPNDLGQHWEYFKESLRPELKSRAALVETTLRALPEILTGKRHATAVIFPNGSFDLVEAVYQGNPVSDYFNELTAQSLVAYVRERLKLDSAARIRILEIGAGTGATTTQALKRLAPLENTIEEYCFTDLSPTFLTQARRRYSPITKCMRYRILDIEKQPNPETPGRGSYDVIVAANVLHATENIRQTLRNAKAFLKQDGMLLLNELSSNDLFHHLTFGLLEGWWRFKDEQWRIPGSPALTPEQWQKVLNLEGFYDVQFPAASDHHLGQQIITAASDGWARLKCTSLKTNGASSFP